MKIRNGFVSNSSSSSFIVAFPEKPVDVEHVKKMLFGKTDSEFISYYDYVISLNKACETVYVDIKNQNIPTKQELVDETTSGFIEGQPEREDYVKADYAVDKNKYNKEWEEYEEAMADFSEKKVEEFLKENKKAFVYVFEYSDNDGDFFCVMEHGGIFENLPHIRISKH